EQAGAEALVRQREARDGAGDADRERGIARLARIGVALLVEEDVGRRRLRGGLAIVDRDLAVRPRQMDHHIAAATDIAGTRIGDRERKAGGDCRIDRIAALRQKLGADPGGARLLRHHHAVTRGDRTVAGVGWKGKAQQQKDKERQTYHPLSLVTSHAAGCRWLSVARNSRWSKSARTHA